MKAPYARGEVHGKAGLVCLAYLAVAPGFPGGPAQIRTCALTHPALPLGRATAHDVNRPANRSVAVSAPSPSTRTWLCVQCVPCCIRSWFCVQCMPGTTVSPRVRRFAPPTPPHGLPCFVRQLHRYYHRIGLLFNIHPPISISPTLRRPRPWRWALKRSPRSRQDMYIRPWGLRHRGPVRPLTVKMTNILPSTAPIISATRTTQVSLLNNPGHMRRYRHFTSTLTSDRARLAEICTWL